MYNLCVLIPYENVYSYFIPLHLAYYICKMVVAVEGAWLIS